MPSNDELIEKIQEIAETNSIDIPETDGKTNTDLLEILSDLKIKCLIKSIQEAAGAKEVDVPETEGLTNKELAKILSDLKADTETLDAAAKAAVEAKKQAKAAKAAVEAKKKPPYYVTEGKAVTSMKGMLSDGDEIKAAYLADGKKALDKLIEKGFVTKS